MLLFLRKLILREGFIIETEVAINVPVAGSWRNEITGFSSGNIYRFFTREITPPAGQWHAREDIGGANTPFLVAPSRDGSFRFMLAVPARSRAKLELRDV